MSGDNQVLANTLAVADWLRDQGYKVGKSTVYADAKSGLLRPDQEGTFSLETVQKYIKAKGLTLRSQSAADTAPDQQRRAAAEARLAEHKEKLLKLKYEREVGNLIPRSQVEQDLAARAQLLKKDLSVFARSEARGLVDLVNGDPDKTADLIGRLLEQFSRVPGPLRPGGRVCCLSRPARVQPALFHPVVFTDGEREVFRRRDRRFLPPSGPSGTSSSPMVPTPAGPGGTT